MRAVVEGLEQRQLFCAVHALTGSALAAALTGRSSLTMDDDLAPGGPQTVIAKTRVGTPKINPPASAAPADDEPVGAAPGQVNGAAIFGGGIYGAAAANFAARADGLPLLSSRPAAPFTVFLDFDGWAGNGFTGAENWTPYNTDGNAAAFGATEAAAVAEGWRRVASFMAPFDVNVTTVEPANLASTAKNFSWSIISNGVSGGYSYLQLGGPRPSAFNQASDLLTRTSGVLHELGHNFSLQHQSLYDAAGTKTTEYRSRLDAIHGVTMGIDYDGTPPKWTYGHPATSAGAAQDDVAVIASKVKPFEPAGGDGFRPDDVGDAPAAAADLAAGTGGVRTAFGVVERLSDADAYHLDSAGGRYTLSLVPDSPSALDGKLDVYAADGTLLASADDPLKIDAAVTLDLPAGDYYAVVRSHGNYGDVGAYEVRAAAVPPVVPPAENALPAPAAAGVALGSGTAVTVTWAPVAGATGYVVERSPDG
ncbi:MAG: peptidase domain protein, partial [Phycisphaerales bacterium]|nr:peptidase domain protein [Phycisphaerales bacterium]